MKIEQQLQEAYQQLSTQYLSNTPQMLKTARLFISSFLNTEANQARVKALITDNAAVPVSMVNSNIVSCHKVKRRTGNHNKSSTPLNHSALLFINPNGLLELLIMDQRPEKFNKGLIDSSGGCKSYKPAIKIKEPFTEQCIVSHETVLLEICNRSFGGVRVPLALSLFEKAQSSSAQGRLVRQTQDNQLVLYLEHSIEELKFDLISVFGQLALMDSNNQHTRGSTKLNFFLQHMAIALHQFHQNQGRPHGDIKCENFLMDANSTVTLIDEAPLTLLSSGLLNLTPYLMPPEAQAYNIGAADTFCLSLSLLQFIFNNLLNFPGMDTMTQGIFQHLQSLYNSHMDLELPPSKTVQERQTFISACQQRQHLFVASLEQEFINLIAFIGDNQPFMSELLEILYNMLSIEANQRISLPKLIKKLILPSAASRSLSKRVLKTLCPQPPLSCSESENKNQDNQLAPTPTAARKTNCNPRR